MVLQKIKSLEQVQVVESLFRRKSLRFRELTNSGNGPCYLLFHIKKYTKKFLRVKTNVLFVAKTNGVLWYFGQTKPRAGGDLLEVPPPYRQKAPDGVSWGFDCL